MELVDGARRLFAAELINEREVRVLREEPVVEPENTHVTLYQAVPKGRHMDLVVEKATELGVDRIVPLYTERGIVKSAGNTFKADRWRRVAEAAARQSLQMRIPEVGNPVSLPEAVSVVGEKGVLLHNVRCEKPLEEVEMRSPVAVFVGPEGGWSEGELELARTKGLPVAHLGPYRLRSETAGIVAVARVKTALGAYDRG